MQAHVQSLLVILITCISVSIQAIPPRLPIVFMRSDTVRNSSLVQPLLNTCRFSDVINVVNYGLCFDFCVDDDLCVLIKIGSNYESCQLCLYDPEQPSVHRAFNPEQIYVIVEELNEVYNNCRRASCENGGQCRNVNNTYNCECSPGFTGQRCQVDIDECESNPCENGGTCVDGVNSYTCTCQPEYAGDTCQECSTTEVFETDELGREWMIWNCNMYYFDPDFSDFTNAVQRCADIGTQLCVFTTDAEAMTVARHVGDNIWFGLQRVESCWSQVGCSGDVETCDETKAKWRWIDGSNDLIMNDTYWEPNNPPCYNDRGCARFMQFSNAPYAYWRANDCNSATLRRCCKKNLE